MSTRTRHPPADTPDPRAPAIVAFENALKNLLIGSGLKNSTGVPRAFERAPSPRTPPDRALGSIGATFATELRARAL